MINISPPPPPPFYGAGVAEGILSRKHLSWVDRPHARPDQLLILYRIDLLLGNNPLILDGWHLHLPRFLLVLNAAGSPGD